jgi:hypothetical protein
MRGRGDERTRGWEDERMRGSEKRRGGGKDPPSYPIIQELATKNMLHCPVKL